MCELRVALTVSIALINFVSIPWFLQLSWVATKGISAICAPRSLSKQKKTNNNVSLTVTASCGSNATLFALFYTIDHYWHHHWNLTQTGFWFFVFCFVFVYIYLIHAAATISSPFSKIAVWNPLKSILVKVELTKERSVMDLITGLHIR